MLDHDSDISYDKRAQATGSKSAEQVFKTIQNSDRFITVGAGVVCAWKYSYIFGMNSQISRCLSKEAFEETPHYSL